LFSQYLYTLWLKYKFSMTLNVTADKLTESFIVHIEHIAFYPIDATGPRID